ncbi:hypothetical protein JXR93_04985, partial [bacterium]|nr:hypothetical protein [bacterium]
MPYLITFFLLLGGVALGSSFEKGKEFCKEKSYQLCLSELQAFIKDNPKSSDIREAKQLLGRAHTKLYQYTQALEILKPFTSDKAKDEITATALFDYAFNLNYAYGIYDAKKSKEIIEAFKKSFEITKDKDLTKEIHDFIIQLWDNLYYYSNNNTYKKTFELVDSMFKDISTSDEDKALYYYKKGILYYNGYSGEKDYNKALLKAEEYWKTVIKEFPKGEYYYQSLYYLVNLYSSKQDFISALKILEEAKAKTLFTSSHFYTVGNKISEIVNPQLQITNYYTFLPNNKPIVNLSWRNIDGAEFTLYKVENLFKYIKEYGNSYSSYLSSIKEQDLKKVKSWNDKLEDNKDYKYHSKEITLDILPAGTYILKGKSDKTESIVLVNVTANAIVLKVSPDKGLAYVTHAMTGEPVTNANIYITSYRYNYTGRKYETKVVEGKTDDSGVFAFDIPDNSLRNYYSPSLQAISEKNGNVAMTSGYGGYY